MYKCTVPLASALEGFGWSTTPFGRFTYEKVTITIAQKALWN